jgi:ribosome-associated translation inhibitor RaiA
MDIRIKTTDYQLVPETSDYLDERTASIEKLLGPDADASRLEVEVGRMTAHKHGDVWFAEINLMQPGLKLMNARAQGESINAAIDQVKEDITGQLRRGRSAHRRIIRKSGAALKNLLKFGSGD